MCVLAGRKHHTDLTKAKQLDVTFFRLGTNKQAADHYWLMNGNSVKAKLPSADVMAGAGTVARRPEVGRCKQWGGSAGKRKKKKTEQGEKETSERAE